MKHKDKRGKRVELSVLAPGGGAGPAGVAEAIARDLALAHERIGGFDARKRARWLIETFIPIDPATLSTGKLMDLRQEVTALALGLMDTTGSVDLHAFTVGGPWEPGDLWQRVGAMARAYASGEDVPLPPAVATLRRTQAPGPYLHGQVTRATEGLDTAALYAAADLLAACDRVRVCPECQQLFVAQRRQERHLRCARRRREQNRTMRARGPRAKKGGK